MKPTRNKRGWIVLAAILAFAGLWGLGLLTLIKGPEPYDPKAIARGRRGGPEVDGAVFPRYGGSESCRDCHSKAFDLWSRSHHALAERPVRPEVDRAAFDPPRSFSHGTQTSSVRLIDGRHLVETAGYGGRREEYAALRAIGEAPLRQFLVAGPRGRLQTLEASFDPLRGEWFDVFGSEDRQSGEWGHWTGRGMTWNSMCASCHNTRFRKNYDEDSDSYATRQAEMGVGCEACHGPMRAHAEWQRGLTRPGRKDPTLRPLDRDRMFDACGTCHARRMELTGDFEPGDSFFDHHSLTIVDASEVFYADGQVREEDYEWAPFLSSRMHAAGVRCIDCHDAHSGKPVLEGNALCMRCHGGGYPRSPVIDPAKHSGHSLDGAGGLCVNCHMPLTTYMQRHPRRDHGFTIPDPLLTKERGIPNACNRCHSDKDADWAIAAVESRYGPRMDRSSRSRTRAVASARAGDDAGRDGLLALLAGPETPFWKAVAAGLLIGWAGERPVQEALRELSAHPDPLVRENAAASMSPLAEGDDPLVHGTLHKLLDDPARNVRIRTAWVLRGRVDPASDVGKELERFLAHNSDQPTGQVQRGAYHLARGDGERALAFYRKAAEWDPRSAALRGEIAVVLSQLGRTEESLREAEEAVRLEPNEAEHHFRLGLAWNEAGDAAKTVASLEEAVRLDKSHARAWYNLALGRQAAGRSEEALEALSMAEGAAPRDARIPYARATILIQLGRVEEARAAARRALELQPDLMEARELLRTDR